MTEDPIVCSCNDVHRSTIENTIKEKSFHSAEQVVKEFHLQNACGACREEVQEILNESKEN